MDDLLSGRIIFEKDSDHLMPILIADHFKILNEPFLFQNFRNLSFHFGRRDINLFEFGFRPVPNPCEHIGYGICHGHKTPVRFTSWI
jgi:hypothetical protein